MVAILSLNMLELNTMFGSTLSLSFSRDRDNDDRCGGSCSLSTTWVPLSQAYIATSASEAW